MNSFILSAIVSFTVSARCCWSFLKILTYWGKGDSVFLGSKRIRKDIGLLALGIFKENFEACQSYLFFSPDFILLKNIFVILG